LESTTNLLWNPKRGCQCKSLTQDFTSVNEALSFHHAHCGDERIIIFKLKVTGNKINFLPRDYAKQTQISQRGVFIVNYSIYV